MFFNPNYYDNSIIQGLPFLEWRRDDDTDGTKIQIAPMKSSRLEGEISGPIAEFSLSQIFSFTKQQLSGPIEVIYRFPLPGDAAVTGMEIISGEERIKTRLMPRSTAEGQYEDAKITRRKAAILTRESPDIFTLKIHGICPDVRLEVKTFFIQASVSEKNGFSFRIPLTSSPRFVRCDETGSRQAQGNPLAVVVDPIHRFSVQISVHGGTLESPSHPLSLLDGSYVLLAGDVIPDRDFQVLYVPEIKDESYSARVFTSSGSEPSLLALITAPRTAKRIPLDIIVLVDHSGSMNGPKRKAADTAVRQFLSHLQPADVFNIACFDDSQIWFAKNPVPASVQVIHSAFSLLDNRLHGGTQLGVVMEQALGQDRVKHDVSRHLLVISDCEVSDMGRIYQLVRQEQDRDDGRRCSVICIDSSPNSTLARRVAEVSGGVVRFLTSNPNAQDIREVISDIMSSWENVVAEGVRFTVNRSSLISNGMQRKSDAHSSTVTVPPVSQGRASWIIAEAGPGEDPLVCTVALPDGTFIPVTESHSPVVAKLMGAWLISQLEFLMNSDSSDDERFKMLQDLGISELSNGSYVYSGLYPENRMDRLRKSLLSALQQISLETGIISSETAFFAENKNSGEKISLEVIIPSALPEGWSDSFVTRSSGRCQMNNIASCSPCFGGGMDWIGSGPDISWIDDRPGRSVYKLRLRAPDDEEKSLRNLETVVKLVYNGTVSDEKQITFFDSSTNPIIDISDDCYRVTEVIFEVEGADDESLPSSAVFSLTQNSGKMVVDDIPLQAFDSITTRFWIPLPDGLIPPVVISLHNPDGFKIGKTIKLYLQFTPN